MAVMAPARVAAPTRLPWRFGLLSVADVDDDSDPHWTLGGGEAEVDDCLPGLSTAADPCDEDALVDVEVVDAHATRDGRNVTLSATGRMDRQQPTKEVSPGYAGVIDSVPFTMYLLTQCYSVGWLSDAADRAKRAYQIGEEAAITATVADLLVDAPTVEDLGASDCLAEGVGAVESYFASTFGVQPLLLVPAHLGPLAARSNLLVREGDHLETFTGSKVALYPDLSGTGPVIGVGGLALLRSPLAIEGPNLDQATNQAVVLSERSYLPSVACGVAVSAVTEDCTGGAA